MNITTDTPEVNQYNKLSGSGLEQFSILADFLLTG